jgi:hypothetical protein
MKKEITIPVQVQDLKERDLISAADHRKKYSLVRDLQAEDFNRAIVTRLEKDKEKLANMVSLSNQEVDPS